MEHEQRDRGQATRWDGAHAYDLPALRLRTTALLRAHVPLTLLLDLSDPAGPHSEARYGREAGDRGRLQSV